MIIYTRPGYVSTYLRSVCCDAPVLMNSDFACDWEVLHCGRCFGPIGTATDEDYTDLYRDRFPRWVKGENIRRAVARMLERIAPMSRMTAEALQRMDAVIQRLVAGDGTGQPLGFLVGDQKMVARANVESVREQVKGHSQDDQ